uniref:Uncharacterized protein n=1 Tax=Octopus bimaculoides TaxID=37653 RepID=A0A0L8H1G2_OCTBM
MHLEMEQNIHNNGRCDITRMNLNVDRSFDADNSQILYRRLQCYDMSTRNKHLPVWARR